MDADGSDAGICRPRPVSVRTAHRGEWPQLRLLRLEMLEDSPHSFGDRLEDAREWDAASWRARLGSRLMSDSTLVVAVDDTGRWLGQMGAREYHHDDPPRLWLLEVYVTPSHRGTGVAERLLAAVERWGRERGFDALHLDVHERAAPARRFYTRLGFCPTGHSCPYQLNRAERELEYRKHL